MSEWIFSYGTLRQAEVQFGVFGRLPHVEADALLGYRSDELLITDPDVIALSGTARHPVLTHTGDSGDRIEGVALSVTPDELLAADDYEVDDYHRERVLLESGRSAWVFVASTRILMRNQESMP